MTLPSTDSGVPPYACGTDKGCVRPHNEDAFAARPELGLWLVADGMGGASSGEVASAITAESIVAAVARGVPLADAVAQAHRRVLDGVEDGRGGPGMGSTAVALRLTGGDFELAWVGDSRAFRFDGRRLEQLSHDHSYVQALVDQGVLDASEADRHPARHMLTRVLGGQEVEQVDADQIRGAVEFGQRFLLCSDGLTEELSAAEIEAILGDESDPEAAVRALIAAALDRGGSDNVTVVVIGPI